MAPTTTTQRATTTTARPTTTTERPTTTTEEPTTTTLPSNCPDQTSLTIQNFAFSQPCIDVPVGTTVTVTNRQGNPPTTHTWTADNGMFSFTLNDGQSAHFTFSSKGTFAYHCAIHTFMTGKVIVR